MNHYERLKVSRDAPLEVIRAAYRALAAKHHPDRLSHTQPDAPHADMAALNSAYETLANAATRAAYDADLAQQAAEPPPQARRRYSWRGAEADRTPSEPAASTHFQASGMAPDAQDSRVDVSWLTTPALPPLNPWLTRQRLIPLVSVLGGAIIVVGVWWGRMAINQMEAERTLSSHYGGGAHAMAGGSNPPSSSLPAQSAGRTLPDPSTFPSDAELLAEPPAFLADSLPRSQRPAVRHPLDGTPLNLRTDPQLIDPLAPATR